MEILYGLSILVALLMLVRGVASWSYARNVTGNLVNARATATVNANGVIAANPTVLPGQAGVLTTMSTSTTGSATLGTGHGITTGMRVDIYWSGGQCYGAVVGTVSGLVVPIASVSGGTALPASGTAIVMSPAQSAPFEVIGDNVVGICLTCGNSPGYVVISTNSTDLYANFVQVGQDYAWKTGDGAVPWGTSVIPTKAWFSQSVAGGGNNTAMQAAALTN